MKPYFIASFVLLSVFGCRSSTHFLGDSSVTWVWQRDGDKLVHRFVAQCDDIFSECQKAAEAACLNSKPALMTAPIGAGDHADIQLTAIYECIQ